MPGTIFQYHEAVNLNNEMSSNINFSELVIPDLE